MNRKARGQDGRMERAGTGALVAASLLAGCAGTRSPATGDPGVPPPPPPTAAGRAPALPAPILHAVFIRLKDPLDTAELSRDSLEAAAQIPSVAWALAGLHLETGRPTVVRDYDLCFTLGFTSRDDYEAYIAHPAHEALLAKWRDRIEWLRIYDAQDVRP